MAQCAGIDLLSRPNHSSNVGTASRNRAKRTNDALAHLNLRTAQGRRIADLARAYLASAGNPSDVARRSEIVGVAELEVLAEEARAAALRDPDRDLDKVVRIQGMADRARRRLGIKVAATDVSEDNPLLAHFSKPPVREAAE